MLEYVVLTRRLGTVFGDVTPKRQRCGITLHHSHPHYHLKLVIIVLVTIGVVAAQGIPARAGAVVRGIFLVGIHLWRLQRLPAAFMFSEKLSTSSYRHNNIM